MKQPHYDYQFAEIIKILKERGLECHVTLKGELTLCKKVPRKKKPTVSE